MTEQTEELYPDDLLAVIEEANQSTDVQSLRQAALYGVGALIPSVSCVWTELDVELFQRGEPAATFAHINDDDVDVPSGLALFNQHVWQHPVVAHVIGTCDQDAYAMSDFLNQDEFRELSLYSQFYKNFHIEDQLSAGFIDNMVVKGLSVNRSSWGFTPQEKSALGRIGRCIFPLYKSLTKSERLEAAAESVFEFNHNTVVAQREFLGLTKREAEVLATAATGKSNKQIAHSLGISEGTVRKHLEKIYSRLDVNNRISAVVKAADAIRQNANAI